MTQLLGVNFADLKLFRLIGLGLMVLSVFLLSFGPFIWMVVYKCFILKYIYDIY